MIIDFSDSTIQAAFISLLGSIFGAFISLGGALIAAFLASKSTAYYLNKKENDAKKELLESTKKSLISLLNNIYLIGVDQMIEDCNKFRHIANTKLGDDTLSYNDSNFLQSNFYDLIDKNELTKLFINLKIEISELASIIIIINTCKSQVPEEIIKEYIQCIDKVFEDQRKDIDSIHLSSDEDKQTQISEVKNMYYTTYLLYKKDFIKVIDHSEKQFFQLKHKINDLLKKLE